MFQKNVHTGLLMQVPVKSVLKLNQKFFVSFEYLGIGKKGNSESNYSQTPLNMDTHIKWTVLFVLMCKLYIIISPDVYIIIFCTFVCPNLQTLVYPQLLFMDTGYLCTVYLSHFY